MGKFSEWRVNPLQLLGEAVRANIDSRMQTVFLTDYKESSGDYDGEAHRNNKGEGSDKLPVVTPVHGLVPYDGRSTAPFQFVAPGEDEEPLLRIGRANAEAGKETLVEQPADDTSEISQNFDPRDKNQDGTVDKDERRAAKQEKRGE